MATEQQRRWERALDELEGHLDELACALDADEPVAEMAWHAPGDLGAPPASLQPRAQAVAVRLTHLRQRADARLADLGSELQGFGRRRRAGTAYASEDVG